MPILSRPSLHQTLKQGTASVTAPGGSRYPTGQIDFTRAGTYSLSGIMDVLGAGILASVGPVRGTVFSLQSSTEIRSDVSLPAPLDLADADQAAVFNVAGSDIGVANTPSSYDITSLTQTQLVMPAIPLPAGLPLMPTGLLGLLLARCRSSKAWPPPRRPRPAQMLKRRARIPPRAPFP